MNTVSPSLKIGLQFLGAWPNMPYGTINRLVYISSILIVQYFQYLYLFVHCKSGNLQNLVNSLPVTFDYSLTFLKLVTLWMNQRVVREILAHIDIDWRECVSVEQDLHIMTTKASISHFCTKFMISFNIFAGALYIAGDYTIGIIRLGNNDTSRPFPINMQFPSEAEQSPIYELLVVVLFVHVLLNTYTVAILNALILTLVLHASGQIEIICEDIKITPEKVSCYRSCNYTLGILIEKHKKVITFSDNMDKLFSFMALMQVFWDTLVICSLGFFIISFDNDTFVLMKTAFGYSAIMMEIFLFCFAGEYLSLKSRSFAAAAYESVWYNMSCSESKNILLVIMRSQKQLSITAGGMINLSLEIFTSIMKTSASYVSVLHAMY